MLCSHNRRANTMNRGEWQPFVLAAWRNVAEQPTQTVMRADGLQQVLGGRRRLPLRTVRQVNGATPSTQNGGRCFQMPRLPHKQPRAHGNNREPSAPPEPAQCHECPYTCHTKRRSMSPSATPSTQSGDRCRQAPHLPQKQRHQSQHSSTSVTPATQSEGRCRQVPRLPNRMEVDASKCHACHTNRHGDNGDKRKPSAPPEPAQCHKCHACHAK